MKRVLSLIIGLIALTGIISLTIYTLTNKGIKQVQTPNNSSETELVNSSYNGNTLAELYNIYLNNEKHKFKLEYKVQIDKKESLASLDLIIYFDGGNIVHEDIINNVPLEEAIALDMFKNTDVSNLKLDIKDIVKVQVAKKDYILLQINSLIDGFTKSKYFLINGKGDLLVSGGSTIYDNHVHYLDSKGEELNIFYDDEEQIMTKYDNGEIYTIEVIENKKTIDLVECKYYFEDEKSIREELNTYKNVKVEENTLPNKEDSASD